MDILESALDEDDPHHIMCALPTGFGKSMPMLMLGHLLPPGAVCLISDWDVLYIWTGSITLIVVPLIPIEIQLLEDCQRLGLTALAGSQVWNTFKITPSPPWSKLNITSRSVLKWHTGCFFNWPPYLSAVRAVSRSGQLIVWERNLFRTGKRSINNCNICLLPYYWKQCRFWASMKSQTPAMNKLLVITLELQE